MVLHTLNALPASIAFRDCLAMAAAGDSIVLLGQGIYAATTHCVPLRELLASGARVYALRVDVDAAGIDCGLRPEALLDMSHFVALTEEFQSQLAWY